MNTGKCLACGSTTIKYDEERFVCPHCHAEYATDNLDTEVPMQETASQQPAAPAPSDGDNGLLQCELCHGNLPLDQLGTVKDKAGTAHRVCRPCYEKLKSGQVPAPTQPEAPVPTQPEAPAPIQAETPAAEVPAAQPEAPLPPEKDEPLVICSLCGEKVPQSELKAITTQSGAYYEVCEKCHMRLRPENEEENANGFGQPFAPAAQPTEDNSYWQAPSTPYYETNNTFSDNSYSSMSTSGVSSQDSGASWNNEPQPNNQKKKMMIIGGVAAAVVLVVILWLCGAFHRHDYSIVVSTDEATCTEDGSQVKECKCGKQKTEVIPALGHNWSEATCLTASECSRCGETQGSPLGHSFSNHQCTRCDKSTFEAFYDVMSVMVKTNVNSYTNDNGYPSLEMDMDDDGTFFVVIKPTQVAVTYVYGGDGIAAMEVMNVGTFEIEVTELIVADYLGTSTFSADLTSSGSLTNFSWGEDSIGLDYSTAMSFLQTASGRSLAVLSTFLETFEENQGLSLGFTMDDVVEYCG